MRAVVTEGGVFSVVDDVRLTWQALVIGRVVDELTGVPPDVPVAVDASLRGVTGPANRFGVTRPGGGIWTLTGVPDVSLPDLATTPATIDVAFRVPGYLRADRTVVLPLNSTLPFGAGDVPLRRPGLRLFGRVTTGTPPAPSGGATVEVVTPAGLLAVDRPLRLPHPTGTSVVRCAFTTVVATPLELTADVDAGDVRAPLARRTGLAPGAVLALGSGGGDAELGVVAALEGSADLDRAGVAVLRDPVIARHRRAAGPAYRVTVTPVPGAVTTLVRPSISGDEVILVASTGVLPDGIGCRIGNPLTATHELRRALRPRGVADPRGYYRTAPVGGAISVDIQVTPPGGPPRPHVLPYERPAVPLNLHV
jgi:hypothetical protein